MKLEDLIDETGIEDAKLAEGFATAFNFVSRMSTSTSQIGPKGRREIADLEKKIQVLFRDFKEVVRELAKEDLKNTDAKNVLDQRVIQDPEDVAIMIFERIFKKLGS